MLMAGQDDFEAPTDVPESQPDDRPAEANEAGQVDDQFRMLLETSSLGTPAARRIRSMTAPEEAEQIMQEQSSGSSADAGELPPAGSGAVESAMLAVPERFPNAEYGDDIIETMIGAMKPREQRGGFTLVVSFCREEPLADRYHLLKLVTDAMTASHPLRWYWTALNDADAFLLPITLADVSLVGDVVKLLEQKLAAYNTGQERPSQLKVTLHAGMAALGFEANSPAPIFTRRLLGAKEFDRFLDLSPSAGLAMILPDWIFRRIQESRYDIGMSPKMFRRTYLRELSTAVWVYVGRSSGLEGGGVSGPGSSPVRDHVHEIERNLGASTDPQAGQALVSSGVFIMCVDSLDDGESFPQRSWAAVMYALQSAAFATGVVLQEPRCFERNGYAVFAISALPQWEAASILPAVATRLRTSSAHTLPVRAGWVNMPEAAGSDLLADLALLAEPGDCGLRSKRTRSMPRTLPAESSSGRVLQRQRSLLLAVELNYKEAQGRDGFLRRYPSGGEADVASVLYAMIHQALAAAARIWNPTTYETGESGLLVVVQAPIWQSSELHELVEDLVGLVGRFNSVRSAADHVRITLALHGAGRTGQDERPNRQLMQLMQLLEIARADSTPRADLAVITSDHIHSELRAGPYFSNASPVTVSGRPAGWLAYPTGRPHEINDRPGRPRFSLNGPRLKAPAVPESSERAHGQAADAGRTCSEMWESDLDSVATPAAFAAALKRVHAGAGSPSYRRLEAVTKDSPFPLRRSTIADFLAARRMPSKGALETFLRACDVAPPRIAAWEAAWRRLKSDDRQRSDRRRGAPATAGPAAPAQEGSSSQRPGFWSALTSVERADLLAIAQEAVHPAGTVLWEEDDVADHAIVIKSGSVRVCVERDGRERIIAFRGRGDIVGERAALLLRRRSATIVAMEPLHVLGLTTQQFVGYLSAHPRVVGVLEGEMYERLTEEPLQQQGAQWTAAGLDGEASQYAPPHPASLVRAMTPSRRSSLYDTDALASILTTPAGGTPSASGLVSMGEPSVRTPSLLSGGSMQSSPLAQQTPSMAFTPAASSGPAPAHQHCTIVFTDITGFSSRSRDEKSRIEMRRAMFAALRESFEEARIPWESCYSEDRGDGALIVVPAEVPSATVVDPVIASLEMRLRRHNRRSASAARIQLRVAVDVGPVLPDPPGVSGWTIINAARLLDAAPLRQRLAATGADLGVIASGLTYDTVIAHNPGHVNADEYESVSWDVKGTRIKGWIYLSGCPQRFTMPAGGVLLGSGVRPATESQTSHPAPALEC